MAQLEQYDLILLDLNLPGIDGLDLLRTLRAEHSETKVLILSARSSVSDRIVGLDAGADDYLIKPFAFGELEARIRTLLRREYTHGEASPTKTCRAVVSNRSFSQRQRRFSMRIFAAQERPNASLKLTKRKGFYKVVISARI